MISQFLQSRQQAFYRFIDRRIKPATEHRLNQRSLFIFPTKKGGVFLLIICVLWVLGTNYQNNLVLALAFFMISFFVMSILYTFYNMSGMRLVYCGSAEAFVGQQLRLRFSIHNEKQRWLESIHLRWRDQTAAVAVAIAPQAEKEVSVPIDTVERGLAIVPRMLIESVFPLGIVRCWTWVNWDIQALVYPAPMQANLQNHGVEDDAGDGLHPTKGGEDFNGLRDYVAGDGLKNIAWKAFARGQGLFVKDFSQNVSRENWLDFDAMPSRSQEEKLSIMCYWVLAYYQQEENFGLRLPGVKLAPQIGFEHRKTCLDALASHL